MKQRKVFKRFMSVMLAVCMMIAIVPGFTDTADAATVYLTKSIFNKTNALPDYTTSITFSTTTPKTGSTGGWSTVGTYYGIKVYKGYGNSSKRLLVADKFVFPSDSSELFKGRTKLQSIDFGASGTVDTSTVTTMKRMFQGCTALTEINWGSFSTGNVTDMESMFEECSGLTSLNLTNFDTKNVTTMKQMFRMCTGLTDLNLAGFNTGKVTNMFMMFYHCTNLRNLNTSTFNTGNVTDMGYMFGSCESFTSLDLRHFNTGKVENMNNMFGGCKSLQRIDVSSFDTRNVTYMGGMFHTCTSLTNLDLSNFDTGKVRSFKQMFSKCTNLVGIDISNFELNKDGASLLRMFGDCTSLENVRVGEGFDTANVKKDDVYDYIPPASNPDNTFLNTPNLKRVEKVDGDGNAVMTISLGEGGGNDLTFSTDRTGDISVPAGATIVTEVDGNKTETTVTSGKATLSKDGTVTASEDGEITSYGISISPSSAYYFADAAPGYGEQSPLTVTVSNTGTVATGALNVALSGANSGAFTLSKTSLDSIAAGTAEFTVVPKTGLPVGSYTATVTVSGNNNIKSSLDVSFAVSEGALSYGLSIEPSGTYTFLEQVLGYEKADSKEVTVTNTGTGVLDHLTIALSGNNQDSFTLSTESLSNIGTGQSAAFTVTPKAGLEIGTYTATVTVSGNENTNASLDVSFTVVETEPVYGISLSKSGTHTFTAANKGYGNQNPLTVTVTNTGTGGTGDLTVELSGTNQDSFTLSSTSIASIAKDGTATFKVEPKTGLAVGTYTATVTVRGAVVEPQSFDVSFKVNNPTSGGGTGGGGGGGGGGYTAPVTQTPIIEAGEGVKVSLSTDGTTASITVAEGYEIADVTLNGTSKGAVTTVSGLKTGDKLVVTVTKKDGSLTQEEQKKVDTITAFKLSAKSKQVKLKSGKRAIRITWNKSEYDFDGVEVWRSMKRNSGYGKKPMWTIKAKNTKYYYNSAIKKGKRYYYKLRGYVEINGQKYYTPFSNKVYRTVK